MDNGTIGIATWLGAVGGGAAAGALAGSVAGPVGGAIGALAGAVAGAIVGRRIGRRFVRPRTRNRSLSEVLEIAKRGDAERNAKPIDVGPSPDGQSDDRPSTIGRSAGPLPPRD